MHFSIIHLAMPFSGGFFQVALNEKKTPLTYWSILSPSVYQCVNGGTNEEIRLDLLGDVFARCIGETLNTAKRPLG